jgi:hypothetical protein
MTVNIYTGECAIVKERISSGSLAGFSYWEAFDLKGGSVLISIQLVLG